MSEAAEEGEMKVWHVPQIPCPAFEVQVGSLVEAVKVMNLLALYDQFQFDHKIKPDYANVSGVVTFEDSEWVEVDDDELQEAAMDLAGAS